MTAYNVKGESVFSNEVSATPQIPDPITFIKNVDYNEFGQISKIEYGNGTVTNYSYNPYNLRLTRILTVDLNGSKLQDLNYTYDGVGNIMAITDSVNTASEF